MNLRDGLGMLHVQQRTRDALQELLRKTDQHIYDQAQLLRKVIEGGETTGNFIDDLVIRFHGGEYRWEEIYRLLASQLWEKATEYVLLSYEVDDPFSKRLVTGDRGKAGRWRIGVLQHDSVRVSSAFVGLCDIPDLPVYQCIEGCWPGMIFDERDLDCLGEVFGGGLFAQKNNFPPDLCLGTLLERPDWQENLIIGDEDVREWLRLHNMPYLFEGVAGRLGKSL